MEDLEIAWPPVVEGHEIFEDLGVYHEAILGRGDRLHGIKEAAREETIRFRFSAKRFAAMRGKLGLSAGDMGTLVGV